MSAPARFLAIHGMKRRWAEATVEEGLIRDSAAWFVFPSHVDDVDVERTLAAAIFLALAPATRARLSAESEPGAYGNFFASAEELLPAVLFFADQPTGWEEWHRYVWTGAPQPGTTFPYTKVARAARRVRFRAGATHVAHVDRAMLARAESIADRVCTGLPCPTELTRVASDARPPAAAEWLDDKLARVCAGIAGDLRVETMPAVARLLGHDIATAHRQ